jgi:biopolymer transport protein ExbD
MARKVSEVNASSVADIAFLLLIFFLVATTMDVDSGIIRKLPPMPEPGAIEDNKQIKERNIFVVLINANDQVMVEGKQTDVHYLRKEAKEFIVNPSNKVNLPEKEAREIDYFGTVMAPKGVISLMNDRGTSYGMYITVQNELIAAYREVRNEVAMSKFGKLFEELPEDKQEAVKKFYPLIISEAEPKDIGGGN